ncbi:DUF86 domain-containing protein [Paenibacillus senegalensis]|uniref:DUF86 domain-containing protein n=1 Tax=Paenibacillus senegalensis TaxID=1465766 RepID=UPI000288113F|nr:HepT-like ribonuclease domain-containing protein [Paenibacillus senegalensis]
MYYINREQLNARFAFMAGLIEASREVIGQADEDGSHALKRLAEERLLHLAIENITDIGSLMIDGFLMRDASSYEDIVEILLGEKVFPEEVGKPVIELVKLRKPLVQNYFELDRSALKPHLERLPGLLEQFAASAQSFIERELGAAGQSL